MASERKQRNLEGRFMMKKALILLLTALVLLLTTGCLSESKQQPNPKQPLHEVNIIQQEDVPSFIINNHTDVKSENYYAYQLENVLYIIATRGERPTSGYNIAFVSYKDNQDQTWDIYLETKEPAKDEIVLTVITYPAAFSRFYPNAPVLKVNFYVDGKPVRETSVETLTAPTEEVEVDLFFGTPDAYLRKETRPVPASFLTIDIRHKAELLINELLKGPMAQAGTMNVIPPGTKVLEVTYQADTKELSLTLSSQFANLAGSAGETLAVYSIVNTLTNLDKTNTVTIIIDGAELQHMDQLDNLTYSGDLVK